MLASTPTPAETEDALIDECRDPEQDEYHIVHRFKPRSQRTW